MWRINLSYQTINVSFLVKFFQPHKHNHPPQIDHQIVIIKPSNLLPYSNIISVIIALWWFNIRLIIVMIKNCFSDAYIVEQTGYSAGGDIVIYVLDHDHIISSSSSWFGWCWQWWQLKFWHLRSLIAQKRKECFYGIFVVLS